MRAQGCKFALNALALAAACRDSSARERENKVVNIASFTVVLIRIRLNTVLWP